MDLDVVIRLDEPNVRKAVEILSAMGLKPRAPVDPGDFSNAAIRQKWIDEKGMMVFNFIDPTGEIAGIDIFARYPMDYEQMLARSEFRPLGNVPVRVCSLDDLIEIKKSAARPVDLLDVTELEIIRASRQNR